MSISSPLKDAHSKGMMDRPPQEETFAGLSYTKLNLFVKLFVAQV